MKPAGRGKRVDIRTTLCRNCGSMCPVLVTIENGRPVKVEGDRAAPIYGGYTCPKGRALPEQHASPGRLLHSMKRGEDGTHRPIPSERAMDVVAERVSAIVAEHGPRAVALYIGTNALPYPASPAAATAFLIGLGSRMMFSSNTIDFANNFYYIQANITRSSTAATEALHSVALN